MTNCRGRILDQAEAAPAATPVEESKSAEHPANAREAVLSLQQAAGNQAVTSLLAPGSGQPLDAKTRGEMEERFGEDFGDVRIHSDEAAAGTAAMKHPGPNGQRRVVQWDFTVAPPSDELRQSLTDAGIPFSEVHDWGKK